MAALEPELSESSIVATLPADIAIFQPSAELPVSMAAWCGEWSGWAGPGRSHDIKLLVESVSLPHATILCARASDHQGAVSERVLARFHENELQGQLTSGANLYFRLRKPDIMEVFWCEVDGHWIAGVLSQQSANGQRLVERVPTGMFAQGREITLEMVTFKPAGAGPFPNLLFQHGSTGSGSDPSSFTNTVTSPALAKFFNDRGWMVMFPQRRGRGKSDGLYDEGFEPDRSQYSDRPEFALPGVDHALCDLDAVIEHVLGKADVDPAQMLIGGHSRGAFLSLAFAAARPLIFKGVLNFVGGWVDDSGPASDSINGVIARRGGTFPGPSIWLYAENDPFYGIAHSRKNFEAFIAAGGQGNFHVLTAPPGHDGHHIVSLTDLWGPVIEQFLARTIQRTTPHGNS